MRAGLCLCISADCRCASFSMVLPEPWLLFELGTMQIPMYPCDPCGRVQTSLSQKGTLFDPKGQGCHAQPHTQYSKPAKAENTLKEHQSLKAQRSRQYLALFSLLWIPCPSVHDVVHILTVLWQRFKGDYLLDPVSPFSKSVN